MSSHYSNHGSARGNVIALLALVITLVCVMLANPVPRGKTIREQLREYDESSEGRRIHAEQVAAFNAAQKEREINKAMMDSKVRAALESANIQTPLPPPPRNPNGPPPAMLGN